MALTGALDQANVRLEKTASLLAQVSKGAIEAAAALAQEQAAAEAAYQASRPSRQGGDRPFQQGDAFPGLPFDPSLYPGKPQPGTEGETARVLAGFQRFAADIKAVAPGSVLNQFIAVEIQKLQVGFYKNPEDAIAVLRAVMQPYSEGLQREMQQGGEMGRVARELEMFLLSGSLNS